MGFSRATNKEKRQSLERDAPHTFPRPFGLEPVLSLFGPRLLGLGSEGVTRGCVQPDQAGSQPRRWASVTIFIVWQ